LLGESLELGWARGKTGDVIASLEGLVRLAAVVGQQKQAARLFGAAAGLRDEIAMPYVASETARFEPILLALHEELGDDGFAVAVNQGRALTRPDAIAAALTFCANPLTAIAPTERQLAAAHGLTRRELEVLRLSVAGHSTREVGELLFISPATVARHLANIYGKLGVDSRASLSAYAHRQGLI
jgi:DNA-binding CsgD family transcriptional regulator